MKKLEVDGWGNGEGYGLYFMYWDLVEGDVVIEEEEDEEEEKSPAQPLSCLRYHLPLSTPPLTYLPIPSYPPPLTTKPPPRKKKQKPLLLK